MQSLTPCIIRTDFFPHARTRLLRCRRRMATPVGNWQLHRLVYFAWSDSRVVLLRWNVGWRSSGVSRTTSAAAAQDLGSQLCQR